MQLVFLVWDSPSKEEHCGHLETHDADRVTKNKLSTDCPYHPSEVAGVPDYAVDTTSYECMRCGLFLLHDVMERFSSCEFSTSSEEMSNRNHY